MGVFCEQLARNRAKQKVMKLWSPANDEKYEHEVSPITVDQRVLQSDNKILLLGTIKTHMVPTHEQQKSDLHGHMSLVIQSRRDPLSSIRRIRRSSADAAVHHEDVEEEACLSRSTCIPDEKKLGLAAEWVLQAPSDMRKNALCKLQTAVEVAYRNLKRKHPHVRDEVFKPKSIPLVQDSIGRSICSIYPKTLALIPSKETQEMQRKAMCSRRHSTCRSASQGHSRGGQWSCLHRWS
jgi:hypothetical protein